MPNKTPRALTICGSWVFLLGVAPLFKAAFAFLAVLPRIHELGLANSYVIAVGTFMPDHVWILKHLGNWIAHPLPITDALYFRNAWSGLCNVLNFGIQMTLLVVGIALVKGRGWSRLGFLTVFGWVFVSHSLQEVLLLSQRVNMFGIAAVAPEAVVLFVAWGSPLLLFLSPSARAYFRQPDRLKEGAI